MFYVYVHYKADTKEPFYVGKGTKDRATITYRRSSFWTNIYKKHGFYHEIIQTFPTEEEAFQLEKELIASLSKTHKLANLTAGGEGSAGYLHTLDSRRRMSLSGKGKEKSQETREKISISNAGKKRSPETCKRIAEVKTQGYVYGISETNLVVFRGRKDIESRPSIKFNSGAIYQQLQGKVNHHKGFKFYRTKDLTTIPRDLPSLDKETKVLLG